MQGSARLDPQHVLAGFEGTMLQLRKMPLFKPDPDVLLGLMATRVSEPWEHGETLAVRVFCNARSVAAHGESRWL